MAKHDDESVVPTMICQACRRFRLELDPLPPRLVCEAFPAGIPKAITQENFDHRQPFKGDNGIRFALKEGGRDTLEWWEKYAAGELPFQQRDE